MNGPRSEAPSLHYDGHAAEPVTLRGKDRHSLKVLSATDSRIGLAD